MYMNVTVYCCKRGVKHRIKDVKHSIQSVTVDETNYILFLLVEEREEN